MRKIYLLGVGLMLMASNSIAQYCVGGGTSSSGDTNVELVVLNGETTSINYAACPGVLGVDQQLGQVADLIAGNSYSIDVTWGTCADAYSSVGTIWIDYDGSETFDASEIIGTVDYGGGTNLQTYPFTVPLTALNGTPRIRVMQDEFGSLPLDPCSDVGYGSVQDFTIGITGGSSCAGPTALNVSGITFTSADLNWTPDGGAVDHEVEWGLPGFAPGTAAEVGSASTVVGGTTNATGLTAETDYEFYVMTNCGGSTSGWAGPFPFFTGYCAVSVSFGDYLSDITTTGADVNVTYNATTQPAGAYANESASEVHSFESGTFDINTTYVGGSNGVKVWVDFNNDLDFDDLGEELFYLANTAASKTGTITVPALTPVGNYRMRVRGTFGSTSVPTSCGNATYGSTVDFTLVVNAPPSCPPPTLLSSANSTTTSTELSWTENGSATSWLVEYGTPGFTPGINVGTTVTAGTNISYLLSGLTANNLYDVYVRSFCSVGDTSTFLGPISVGTFDLASSTFMAVDEDCPVAGFTDISGTGVGYDLADDGEQNVTMTFPFIFQGTIVTDLRLGNNGGMLIGATAGNVGTGGNMNGVDDGVYPWFDDMDSETGDVFYEEIGVAPNRIAIVQWDNLNNYSNGATTVTFQVQIHETTNEIYFVYDDVEFGTGDDFGANADIGLAGPLQDFNVSNNDAAYLMANSCVRFYYPTCPAVSNITSTYSSIDSLEIGWTSNGTESDWIIEYGPTGFTQGSGIFVNTTSNPDTLGGLVDNTMYDIYVYADCGAGDTSVAVGPETFATDVVCAPVTALAFEYTSNDTVSIEWTLGGLEAAWNVEWGTSGFVPGMGNGTLTNVTTFPDTTFGVPAGGVYDFYVQADCGAGVNNPWTGPITYISPILNDSTCDAIVVPVDGSTTVYANVGATTQVGSTVAGFNTIWFEFVAPASGHVEIMTCGNDFDNMLEVYEATDCSDFGTFTLVDGATGNPFGSCAGTFDPAGMNLCGLTPGNTYYLTIGSETDGVTGTFPLTLTELPAIEAGTAVNTDICEDNAALDLFTLISGNLTTTGQWYFTEAMAGNELPSLVNVVGLPIDTYDFAYVQNEVCGSDTVTTSITLVATPNVGVGSTIDAGCNHNSVALTDGLSGTVDFGGTWYDESSNDLGTALLTFDGEPAGSYDYYYVVDNGVCAADTATVTVDVIDCASIGENSLGLNVYPNPVKDVLTINLLSVSGQATVELFNLQGSLVSAPIAINSSSVNVNMADFADGVYILKVTSNGATEEVRVVKQ